MHSSPRFFRRNGSTREKVDILIQQILMDVLQEREIFIDKLKRQERRVNEWNMLIQKIIHKDINKSTRVTTAL